MPALKNPRHEAFAQTLARGMSASAAYVEAGYKANRHNAAALAREKHIRTRVAELQEEQLAIHKQATVEAVANAKVTIERSRGRSCQGYVREGRRCGRGECPDSKSQAGRHVAR